MDYFHTLYQSKFGGKGSDIDSDELPEDDGEGEDSKCEPRSPQLGKRGKQECVGSRVRSPKMKAHELETSKSNAAGNIAEERREVEKPTAERSVGDAVESDCRRARLRGGNRRVTIVRGRGGRGRGGRGRKGRIGEGRTKGGGSGGGGLDNTFVLDFEEGEDDFPCTLEVEEEDFVPEERSSWRYIEEEDIDILLHLDVMAQEELLTEARKEVKYVCERIRRKAGVTSNTEVSLQNLLNMFLPRPLILLMAEEISSNLISNGERKPTVGEFCLALRALLCCIYYGKSISQILGDGHFRHHPLLREVGVESFQRERLTKILMGLNGSVGYHRGMDWDPVFQVDKSITRCEQELSRSAAEVAFTPYTMLCMDDDQLGLRAHDGEDTGLAQVSNPMKRFGPVQHCGVSSLTQLWVCGHYQLSEKESARKVMQTLLQNSTGSLTSDDVNIRGRTLALDRGYLCSSVISYLDEVNARYLGTHKRSCTFPFTFGAKSSSLNSGQQRLVEERGARAHYWASLRSEARPSRAPDYAVAYRDGTKGKVTLLATNNPDWGPDRFIYKRASKARAPVGGEEEVPSCIRKLEEKLKVLTVEQGGQEWFVLRLFRFTSSTSAVVLRTGHTLVQSGLTGVVSEYEQSLRDVSELIGVRSRFLNEEITRKESSEILSYSLARLKSMCRDRGLSMNGNKSKLVERIKSFEGLPEDIAGEEMLKKLFLKWFLKPLSNRFLTIGGKNERRVAKGLVPFLKEHATTVTPISLHFRGLVCKKDEPWVASSVDGMLAFSTQSSSGQSYMKVGCIEIKTVAAEVSESRAKSVSRDCGKYIEISLDGNNLDLDGEEMKLFRRAVPSVDHRCQILHHAATWSTTDVFYCVSSTTNILYVARIVLSLPSLSAYCNILNVVALKHLRWVYFDDPFPKFESFSSDDFGWAKDRNSVYLNYKIWSCCSLMSDCEPYLGHPWPRAHYIRPKLVYMWNQLKGGVDVYSRILSTKKFSLRGWKAKAQIFVRSLITVLYNVHMSRRLLCLEDDLHRQVRLFDRFRDLLNHRGSMTDTLLAVIECNYFTSDSLCMQSLDTLLSTNGDLTSEANLSLQIDEHEEEEFRKKLPGRRTDSEKFYALWNSAFGTKRRRLGTHEVTPIGYNKSGKTIQKWCRYCSSSTKDHAFGYKTTYWCAKCFNTPLCNVFRRDSRGKRNKNMKTCAQKWHEGLRLRKPATQSRSANVTDQSTPRQND